MSKVNEIKDVLDIRDIGERPQEFEIVVKNANTGQVVYHEKSNAGIFCTLERGKLDFKDGTIEAIHQVLGWGSFLSQFHAREMIEQYFKKNMGKIMGEAKRIQEMKK